MKELRPAIIMTSLFVLLTGLVFPFVIYAFGQVLFPVQANGSFAKDASGKIVGSAIIGQVFTDAKYFHSRPSAAGGGYDPAGSSGTNLGPISAKLIEGIKDDPSTPDADESFAGVNDLAKAYREENGLDAGAKLPADAVTRSSSGLDPDISPANALLQASRVASARKVSVEDVKQAIINNTGLPFAGIFGESHVNVLALNLELDRKSK